MNNEEIATSPAEEALIYDPSKVSWAVANLAKRPPHWSAEIFIYFLLVTLLAGVTYSYFAIVPVSITTQGMIASGKKSYPIVANVPAQIIAVDVANNDLIKKGDVLLVTDKLLDRKVAKELTKDSQYILSIMSLEESQQCKKKCYESFAKKSAELFEANAASPLKEILVQMRDLTAEYLRAKDDSLRVDSFLRVQFRQIQSASEKLAAIRKRNAEDLLKSDIERLTKEVGSAKAQIAERRDRVQTSLSQVVSRLQIRLEKFENDVISYQKENRYFSPVDGYVTEVQISGVGEMIAPGQPLMKIVPTGSKPVAEVMVPNREIARVTKGQEVKIKLEALPESDFGELNGTVVSIPMNVTQGGGGPTPGGGGEPSYKVRISLEKASFVKDGKDFPIRLGMILQAQIVVRKERLLNLGVKKLLKIKDGFI